MEELIRKREMELNEFTFNNFLPEEKLDNTLNLFRTMFEFGRNSHTSKCERNWSRRVR